MKSSKADGEENRQSSPSDFACWTRWAKAGKREARRLAAIFALLFCAQSHLFLAAVPSLPAFREEPLSLVQRVAADPGLWAGLAFVWLLSACGAALGVLMLMSADSPAVRRLLLAPALLAAPVDWIARPEWSAIRAGELFFLLAASAFAVWGLDRLLAPPRRRRYCPTA